jgi:hypothetical protein
MMEKRAPLAGVIVRKGGGEEAASVPAPALPPAAALPPRLGTIAVTLRLDPDRYDRLKSLAAATRRTNQDILTAALDAYLRKQGSPLPSGTE